MSGSRKLVLIGLVVVAAQPSGSADARDAQDGGSTGRAMTVRQAGERLRSLLRKRGVQVGYGRSRRGVRAAWRAFQDFAATPVRNSDLDGDRLDDGMLYEYGAFDFGAPWRKTFELSWTRQFTTRDEDIWQVQFTIHLRARAFGVPAPERTLWSWDTTHDQSHAAQHRAWKEAVAADRVYRQLFRRHLKPIGYELSAGSAE
jgi:hypothetical protein